MAIQTINVGNIANDGTGDELRDAFIKINQNFDDLDLRAPEAITATNVGTGEGVFKSYTTGAFEFRSIAGVGITIGNDGETLTLSADPQTITVITDSGSRILTDGSTLRINGGNNVSTEITNSNLVISSQTVLKTDLTPELGGELNGQQNNITNINLIGANNVTSLVHGVDIRELNKYFEGFDLGSFEPITNYIDWVLLQVDVDMGEFLDPSPYDINLGSI